MAELAEDLYGVDLDEFVAARNQLAKQLRTDKRREEAAQVAALRKPSAALWALNQLARTDPDRIGRVLDTLDRAQHAGDRAALRAALADQREALQEAITAASALLEAAGRRVTAEIEQRLRTTLLAATDDAVAGRLRAGCLAEEPEAGLDGFGFGSALAPFDEPATSSHPDASTTSDGAKGSKRRARAARRDDRAKDDGAKEDEEQAEQRRVDQARVAELREMAEQAEAEAERLAAEADAAERDAVRARRAADEAATVAARARRQADAAAEP